jgi:metal-dependent hydrolase (beta-lactamase superfamily II)
MRPAGTGGEALKFLKVQTSEPIEPHGQQLRRGGPDLQGMCGKLVVVGWEPEQLLPGVCYSGMVDSNPAKQAMIFDPGNQVVAISGCAHPGTEQITQRANRFIGKKVAWAIGGFHLMYRKMAAVEQTVPTLQGRGVTQVVPTHYRRSGQNGLSACLWPAVH